MEIFDICDGCSDWLPGEYIFGDDMFIDDCYMGERWKQYADFPEYYYSDMGRIWSSRTHRFIHGSATGKRGHIDISFKFKDKRYHRYIHRIVANGFVPNPNRYDLVRHLDDDPSNNRYDNLAWGAQTDNMRDAIENGHFKYFTAESREKAMRKRRCPVVAKNIYTGEERYFESQQEASRCLRIPQPSISDAVHKKYRTINGYYFRNVERKNGYVE